MAFQSQLSEAYQRAHNAPASAIAAASEYSSSKSGLSPEEIANLYMRGVASPLLRQFEQEIRPRIREAYSAQGALMSTKRSEAERLSLENLQKELESGLARTQLEALDKQKQYELSLQGLSQQLLLGRMSTGLGYTGQSHLYSYFVPGRIT